MCPFRRRSSTLLLKLRRELGLTYLFIQPRPRRRAPHQRAGGDHVSRAYRRDRRYGGALPHAAPPPYTQAAARQRAAPRHQRYATSLNSAHRGRDPVAARPAAGLVRSTHALHPRRPNVAARDLPALDRRARRRRPVACHLYTGGGRTSCLTHGASRKPAGRGLTLVQRTSNATGPYA